eukprot:4286254-Prymnesium_polylepis.1
MPQTFWTAAETVSVADRFGNVTRLDQNHASVRNHENQLDQRHNCAIFAPVREAQSGSVVLNLRSGISDKRSADIAMVTRSATRARASSETSPMSNTHPSMRGPASPAQQYTSHCATQSDTRTLRAAAQVAHRSASAYGTFLPAPTTTQFACSPTTRSRWHGSESS